VQLEKLREVKMELEGKRIAILAENNYQVTIIAALK
jgi:hypothetical protein